jgi:hypothetical protein
MSLPAHPMLRRSSPPSRPRPAGSGLRPALTAAAVRRLITSGGNGPQRKRLTTPQDQQAGKTESLRNPGRCTSPKPSNCCPRPSTTPETRNSPEPRSANSSAPPPPPQHAATGTTQDQLDNDHPHNAENNAWPPPHSHARRRIAMHYRRDQLRRALQQYSFPAITRNAEYERLPGQHRKHRGRHQLSLLLFGGSLRMISFGREVLPHSYLADTGPD